MAGKVKRTLLLVLISFVLVLIGILMLARQGVLTPQQAGLGAVWMFGMYVGFGILIAVYRLISKLD